MSAKPVKFTRYCLTQWISKLLGIFEIHRVIQYLVNTVMSLLEAPCAKTSWRALLFRTILGITGAVIVCFDIWWFKQVNNSETGFSSHHCDFEQHVPCLAVHVCMNSVKFVLKAPGASILWGRYYSVTMCRLIWGALLLGRALLIGTLRYIYFCNIGPVNIWIDCKLSINLYVWPVNIFLVFNTDLTVSLLMMDCLFASNGGRYSDYYTCTLSLSQATATYLMIRHP